MQLSNLRQRSKMPRDGDTNDAHGSEGTDSSTTFSRDHGDRIPLLEDDSENEVGFRSVEDTEGSCTIALQVLFPYLIAGAGMVAAGLLLDVVQHWPVFENISEIFVLVPALLGLKGNLEMTLASRLSTQANLGNMDSRSALLKMIAGNIILTQAQAIVVGFFASIAAMVMGWIPEGKFVIAHGFLLSASSMMTASLASLVLGLVMISVVLISRKFGINPDNVATPIAASLGDLTTLAILSLISNFLFKLIGSGSLPWLAPLITGLLLILAPVWAFLSSRNPFVSDVIYNGWTPIIAAMLISSGGGLILDFAAKRYQGIAVYQPLMNGVGGNLVAVQASRISTWLHKRSTVGEMPVGALTGCANPCTALCGAGIHPRATRVLLALVVPGHVLFMVSIWLMKAGHVDISVLFVVLYLTAALLQVYILLYVCLWMVHRMWKSGDDPDNAAIPYLTALGDLLGGALLAIVFAILSVVPKP